ncbi:WD40-repeat-containing domain protein [Flagelloscypha sp. PMI_526]|nr:WD40-repeat-containing domain protein [Flagelloscypha sp. PMI_526]
MERGGEWSVGAWTRATVHHNVSYIRPATERSEDRLTCWSPPLPNVREGPTQQNPSNPPLFNLSQVDSQTLFLEGFRIGRKKASHRDLKTGSITVKSRQLPGKGLFKKTFGSRGPSNNSGANQQGSSSTTSAPGGSSGMTRSSSQPLILDSIGTAYFPNHPLDDLIDTIFETFPDIRTAIVHDRDLLRLKHLSSDCGMNKNLVSQYLRQTDECASLAFLSSDFPFEDLGLLIAREAAIHNAATAHSLALTNKRLYATCNPILYQSVKIDSVNNLDRFIWTLSSSRLLAQHVRQLWITIGASIKPDAFKHCVNLSTFGMTTLHEDHPGQLNLPSSVTELFCDPGHFTPTLPPYNPEHTIFENVTRLYMMTKLKKTDVWAWLQQAFIPNLQTLALEFNEGGSFLDAGREMSRLARLHLPTMNIPRVALCIFLLFTKSGVLPALDQILADLSDGSFDPRVVLGTIFPKKRHHPTGYLLNVARDSFPVDFTSHNITSIWDQGQAMITRRKLTGKYPIAYYEQVRLDLKYLHIGWAAAVAFSRDGRFIVSSTRCHHVCLWDADTYKSIAVMKHRGRVMSIAFSPCSRWIVAGSDDSTLCLWDTTSIQTVGGAFVGHREPVTSVGFSPDSRTIVSGSKDRTIRCWDVATRQEIGEPLIGHDGDITSVAFAPDGNTVVSASSDTTIRLWENIYTRWRDSHVLRGHVDPVTSVSFSPDGQRVVSGSADSTIRVWDIGFHVITNKPLCGHSGEVTNVTFTPNGSMIASRSRDNTIRVWDSSTLQEKCSLILNSAQNEEITSIAFSPDGVTLAWGSSGPISPHLHKDVDFDLSECTCESLFNYCNKNKTR